MKTPYGDWNGGVFTNNAGQVYQDDPATMGDGGGWSRAVAADGGSLGDLFKGIFAALGGNKPQGAPTQPNAGTPAPRNSRGTLPVFLRPNSGVPDMPASTFPAGEVPMMARPGTPQLSMPFDTVGMTLDTLKKRAPAKGFIVG